MKKYASDNIAELAGVSRATVSRVINGYPHVKLEVRERVQAIIAETGFTPNIIARSLASDRSGVIGLVIPNSPNVVFTDPYFPTLIQGITQATNRLKLMLSLFLLETTTDEQRTIRSLLNTGLLEGAIITADRREDSFVPRFAQSGLPFVLIGRPETNAALTYIDCDNVGGGYMATEHLIKLGRRRIAMVAANDNTAGDDRVIGYRQALQDYGCQDSVDMLAYGNFSLQSGYDAMKVILRSQPDAVFVASDTMALGALRAIREAGLRVPEDIALVGFDDFPPALQAEPALTTIRQPVEQLGAIAVEKLYNLQTMSEPSGSHTHVRWTFAPAVSVPQDIRWGRVYEGFSEQADVVIPLSLALARGLDKGQKVLHSYKHFAADGGTAWNST